MNSDPIDEQERNNNIRNYISACANARDHSGYEFPHPSSSTNNTHASTPYSAHTVPTGGLNPYQTPYFSGRHPYSYSFPSQQGGVSTPYPLTRYPTPSSSPYAPHLNAAGPATLPSFPSPNPHDFHNGQGGYLPHVQQQYTGYPTPVPSPDRPHYAAARTAGYPLPMLDARAYNPQPYPSPNHSPVRQQPYHGLPSPAKSVDAERHFSSFPSVPVPAVEGVRSHYRLYDPSSSQPSPSSSSAQLSLTSSPSARADSNSQSLPSSNTGEHPPTKPAPHIRRPPNAFMLYRSDFLLRRIIPPSLERRQQNLSKLIGECWQLLAPEERAHWAAKAEERKREHGREFPGYRFVPRKRGTGVKARSKARKGAVGGKGEEDEDRNAVGKEEGKARTRTLRETFMPQLTGPAVTPVRRRRAKVKKAQRAQMFGAEGASSSAQAANTSLPSSVVNTSLPPSVEQSPVSSWSGSVFTDPLHPKDANVEMGHSHSPMLSELTSGLSNEPSPALEFEDMDITPTAATFPQNTEPEEWFQAHPVNVNANDDLLGLRQLEYPYCGTPDYAGYCGTLDDAHCGTPDDAHCGTPDYSQYISTPQDISTPQYISTPPSPPQKGERDEGSPMDFDDATFETVGGLPMGEMETTTFSPLPSQDELTAFSPPAQDEEDRPMDESDWSFFNELMNDFSALDAPEQ